MKKVIAILFALITAFSMVACFNTTEEPETETIKIHDGDRSFEVQAEVDKDLNIIKTYADIYSGKKDYYIEGVYDSQTDGEKYFDQEGDCRAIWSKNFPKEFYVRWESIDNYKIVDDYWWDSETTPKEYDFEAREESFRYSRHHFNSQKGYSSNYLIISNNRDRMIDVKINFRAKTTQGGDNTPDMINVALCDGEDNGKEIYITDSRPLYTSYNDYEFDMQCTMKAFGYVEKTPQRCLFIRFTVNKGVWHVNYYKDLHMSVTILPKQ